MKIWDWFRNSSSDSTQCADNNEMMQTYQDFTREFLDISTKLLTLNSEGGFIKIIFEGCNSGIIVCFMDSYFHRDVKAYGNDWKQLFNSRLNLGANSEDRISNYMDSVEYYVDSPNDICSNITFEYQYSYPLNRDSHKTWCADYLNKNHPKYELTVEKDYIILYV